MSETVVADFDALFLQPQSIVDAIGGAARRALVEHKRLGYPIAEWRDGRVVWISAEEFEVEEPPQT